MTTKAVTTVETRPVLVETPYVFALATWESQDGAHGKQLKPVPGTWHRLEHKEVWGVTCCPNCREPSLLSKRVTKVDRFGKLTPNLICSNSTNGGPCSFCRVTYLDKWNAGKALYAIAIEGFVDGKWKAQIHYCHAQNEREARTHLGIGNYRIVAVGPVIGYNTEDKDGKILSV